MINVFEKLFKEYKETRSDFYYSSLDDIGILSYSIMNKMLGALPYTDKAVAIYYQRGMKMDMDAAFAYEHLMHPIDDLNEAFLKAGCIMPAFTIFTTVEPKTHIFLLLSNNGNVLVGAC